MHPAATPPQGMHALIRIMVEGVFMRSPARIGGPMTSATSSQRKATAKVDFGPRAKAAQFKGVIAAAVVSGAIAAGPQVLALLRRGRQGNQPLKPCL